MALLKAWERNAAHLKQALRVGVAALLCLYITRWLGLVPGYWAAISSIIVLQSHVGATIKASLGRLVATAIGAIVGAVMIALLGNSYLSVALAITLAVLCCIPQRLRDSYRLAGSTVVSIMLSTKFHSPWETAAERFAEVALGILVALVVARSLWPSHARNQLRKEIQQAFAELYTIYKAVVDRFRNGTTILTEEMLSNIRASMLRIRELRQQTSYEQDDVQFPEEVIAAVFGHLRLVRQAVDGMELATRVENKGTLQNTAEPELEQLLNATSTAFEEIASNLWKLKNKTAFAGLSESIDALDRKVSSIVFSDLTTQYSIDDVLAFHGFIVSLRSLTQELSLLGQELIHSS